MSDPAPPKGPDIQAPPVDDPPSPLYAVAPETVRITLMWTGDPAELDRALLALRENSRALRMLANRVHASESTRRALQAERLAGQLLAGALGEDEDEDLDEECHEHLTVVRHDRGGASR
ncbi:MAG: hypothetical protein U0324_29275 [Polyangiales bacterium]